jgi:type IV pilus assembly protein PilQ
MKKGFFQLIVFLLVIVFSHETQANSIQKVDFYQEGELSILEIELKEDAWAERFHISEDKQIILDIKEVKASEKVLRGFDTSEFSGSAVFISGYKKPGTKNDIRFAIQLRDNVRSKLEIRNNTLKLKIENRFGVFTAADIEGGPQKTQENQIVILEGEENLNTPKSTDVEDILDNLILSGPKKYVGKRVSINVKNIEVVDLLKMISDISGFNIIIDDEVKSVPPLTLTLTNIPWDQALDTIMDLSNLVAKKNSNILSITTYSKAVAEKEKRIESEKKIADKEPLVTKIFPISFAILEDIEKILTAYLTKDRGTITSDNRTNSLIVKDTVEVIEKMKKIVETLDTQTPQILIEARIVEASETYSKRIGLENGLSFGYDPVGSIGTATGPGFSFSSATNPDDANLLGVSISVFRRLNNLSFNLQMMESESMGRVVSSPKVITQNKKEATISSEETTSYLVQSAAANQGVAGGVSDYEEVKANLQLKVTPVVTNEGSINLDVNLEKSGFGKPRFPDGPPDITERKIQTSVLIDNGSTIVIGGLYKTQHDESVSGVPFLKDLPLLGWLFRTPYNPDKERNELMIFLTPRIINQEEAGLVDRTSLLDNQAI